MSRTLQIGQRVSTYEVVAELGAGGMAELFLGVDGQRRPVAIKAIRPEHTLDRAFIEMFRDEARIASEIDHANVVKLLETGIAEGNHFLVMEYLNGVTVSALLRRLYEMGRTLNPLAASAIAIRMGRGLHAAHELRGPDGASLNVIHRDVSPQNMMLLSDGQVKLIDFGIAKAAGRTHRTIIGEVKGKLRYMAPEQMVGEPLDRRADIYALGAVLWETLATRRLYGSATDAEVMIQATKGDISPPGAYADVPFALDRVVMRCLTRDPNERFSTAHDFVDAVIDAMPEAAQVDEATLARLAWGVAGRDFDELARTLPIELPTRKTVGGGPTSAAIRELTQMLDDDVEPTAVGSMSEYLSKQELQNRSTRSELRFQKGSLRPVAGVGAGVGAAAEQPSLPQTTPLSLAEPPAPASPATEASSLQTWAFRIFFVALMIASAAAAYFITKLL